MPFSKTAFVCLEVARFNLSKAHKAGVKILVDATFAPPPLFDPFKWGADCILHSGTKYFGGHSDLLAGVIVVRTSEEWKEVGDTFGLEARAFFGQFPLFLVALQRKNDLGQCSGTYSAWPYRLCSAH